MCSVCDCAVCTCVGVTFVYAYKHVQRPEEDADVVLCHSSFYSSEIGSESSSNPPCLCIPPPSNGVMLLLFAQIHSAFYGLPGS